MITLRKIKKMYNFIYLAETFLVDASRTRFLSRVLTDKLLQATFFIYYLSERAMEIVLLEICPKAFFTFYNNNLSTLL